MSELNVRIDPEMAALLERVARQTGRTKSEVVRDALQMLRARATQVTVKPPPRPWRVCWDAGIAAARGFPSALANASR